MKRVPLILLATASLVMVRDTRGLAGRDTAQSPQSTFRAAADVVALDVSVLDEHRKPVRGLTAADFTILEGGQPRPIVNFEAIELPSAAPSNRAAWTRDAARDVITNDPSEGRLVVIMIDHTIASGWPAVAARKIANAAIDQLAPGDLAAVMFTQDFQRPQNFTADRAKLRYAVESKGIGGSLVDNKFESGLCQCGVCSLEAVTRVAEALGGVPRRQKTLLFIGSAIAVAVNPESDPRDCAQITQPATADMFQAAQRANVIIHAFDPFGLLPPQSFSAQSRGVIATTRGGQQTPHATASLQILAERTGGRAVINDNAPNETVADIFAETSAYYLIGFQTADPQQKSSTDFHPIDVRVNRREAVVHTRAGYYTTSVARASAASRAPSALSPLEQALQGQLPKSDFPLRVAIAPVGVPGKKDAALAIVLGLHPTQASGGRVHVLTTAYDTDGVELGSQQHTVDVAAAGGSHDYEVISRIDLRPGHYEIRMAAQDETSGRIASVYTYADIPEFFDATLSMSGVLLEATPSVGAAPRDALASILPVVPTAVRVFQTSSQVRAFARVYERLPDPAKPVTMRARIVNEANRRVFEQATTMSANHFQAGSADWMLDLPISRLTPGEYLLTVECTLGKTTTTRDVTFSVK